MLPPCTESSSSSDSARARRSELASLDVARSKSALNPYVATASAPVSATTTMISSRERTSRQGWSTTKTVLPENPGVPERVAPRLRPNAEPVRASPDGDPRKKLPGSRRERVDDAAVATREPEHP